MKGIVQLVAVALLVGSAAWMLWPGPPKPTAITVAPDMDQPAGSGAAPRQGMLPAPARAPAVAIDTARGEAPAARLPGSLTVRVRDHAAYPVAGARVTLLAGAGRHRSALTGGSGEVLFERLGAGRYDYRVAAPGRPELRAAAPVQLAAGATRVLEVTLGDYDQVIAGHIQDTSGGPVAGLTVKARLHRPPADGGVLVPAVGAQQAATGFDGRFTIEGLELRAYEIRTVADDHYGAAAAVVRAGAEAVLLTVAERRELTVFGQVTSTAQQPLSDVRVAAAGQPSQRARTDEQGWYELAMMVGEGNVSRLRFDAPGYRSAALALPAGAFDRETALRLDAELHPFNAMVAVSVRLVDPWGMPVAGERVHLHSPGAGASYQASTSRAGMARFAEVAAGSDYRLRVTPRALYEDVDRTVDLRDGAELEIALAPLALGTLAGRMVDPSGRPVPDFSLRVESAAARGAAREVRGDADGYFEVEVPEGALTLRSTAPPELRIDGVVVAPGWGSDVELALDWGDGVLAGRVLDGRGNPLQAAEARLRWSEAEGPLHSHSVRSAVTDAHGRFRFSRLGRGSHRLEVRALGHAAQVRSLTSGADWVEVRLERVEDGGGRGLAP